MVCHVLCEVSSDVLTTCLCANALQGEVSIVLKESPTLGSNQKEREIDHLYRGQEPLRSLTLVCHLASNLGHASSD